MLPYHTKELKFRFIFFLLSIVLTGMVVWVYKTNLLINYLNLHLIYTNLTEAFTSYLNFSIYLSMLINIPYGVFTIYEFIKKGLYQYEEEKLKKIIKYYLCILILLMVFIFSFFSMKMIEFFLSFQNPMMILHLKIEDSIKYLQYLVTLTLISSVLPLIDFKYKRKGLYFIILLIGAIITPPDVISLILLAVPLIIILEITHLIKKLVWPTAEGKDKSGPGRV